MHLFPLQSLLYLDKSSPKKTGLTSYRTLYSKKRLSKCKKCDLLTICAIRVMCDRGNVLCELVEIIDIFFNLAVFFGHLGNVYSITKRKSKTRAKREN